MNVWVGMYHKPLKINKPHETRHDCHPVMCAGIVEGSAGIVTKSGMYLMRCETLRGI